MTGRLVVIFVTLLFMVVLEPARSTGLENDAVIKTLDRYLRASYARDADQAYRFLSEADKASKTNLEYKTESGNYAGFTLTLAKALALEIELSDIKVSIDHNRATVNFNADLPDANHPSLRELVLGFDMIRLEALDEFERDKRINRLRVLASSKQMASISSPDEQWELVRENGEWRVFVNWAEAIEVVFESTVSDELGWEFYPSQKRILAQPGQTIQMSYHARNTGKVVTTGKARHVISAADRTDDLAKQPTVLQTEQLAEYLEIIACFCFLEQSLEVSEEVELPLVFRVDYEVPEEVEKFTVRYDFYLDSEFPQHETS